MPSPGTKRSHMSTLQLNQTTDYLKSKMKGSGPMTNLNSLNAYDRNSIRSNVNAPKKVMEIPHKPYYVDFTKPMNERRFMTHLAT